MKLSIVPVPQMRRALLGTTVAIGLLVPGFVAARRSSPRAAASMAAH